MTLTTKQIRAASWIKRFEYKDLRVYTCRFEGFTLVHRGGRVYYRIKGKGETDSLFQGVRWWNDKEQHKDGRPLAGSVAALKGRQRRSSGYRD